MVECISPSVSVALEFLLVLHSLLSQVTHLLICIALHFYRPENIYLFRREGGGGGGV
ncbi:hypothetical protein Hanom_Chr17g01539921 [Helianthus anomalus]